MIEQLTALYSSLDREYAQAVSGPYADLSYKDNDTEVVAAIKDDKISGFWRPVVLLGQDTQKHIERLWYISPNMTVMDFLEDGGPNEATRWLLANGYVAEPYFHQVIDLWPTQDNLWHDVRKSYKSLINNDINRVMLCKNQGQWAEYMRLHAKLAGRQTRTKASWQVQWDMIEQGEAFATMMYAENKRPGDEDGLIAGALFMCNATWVYYASGKSVDQANSHALIWKGVEVAKQRGCHWLDVGQQTYWGDPKMVNISHFKKGMGGTTKLKLLVRPKETK